MEISILEFVAGIVVGMLIVYCIGCWAMDPAPELDDTPEMPEPAPVKPAKPRAKRKPAPKRTRKPA